jgi:hypothetical protein
MAASACSWLPAQPTFFPLVIRFLVPLAHHLPHPNSSTPILHWSCSTQRTSIWTVPWSQFRLSFPADLRLNYNTRSSCISNKRTASPCVYAISSRNSLNVVQHQLVLSVVAIEFSLLSFGCLAYLGVCGTNLMRTLWYYSSASIQKRCSFHICVLCPSHNDWCRWFWQHLCPSSFCGKHAFHHLTTISSVFSSFQFYGLNW